MREEDVVSRRIFQGLAKLPQLTDSILSQDSSDPLNHSLFQGIPLPLQPPKSLILLQRFLHPSSSGIVVCKPDAWSNEGRIELDGANQVAFAARNSIERKLCRLNERHDGARIEFRTSDPRSQILVPLPGEHLNLKVADNSFREFADNRREFVIIFCYGFAGEDQLLFRYIRDVHAKKVGNVTMEEGSIKDERNARVTESVIKRVVACRLKASEGTLKHIIKTERLDD